MDRNNLLKYVAHVQNKYFLVAVFTLFTVLIFGYEFSPNTYQIQDIPFINKIVNPSLYPNDIFVNTLGNFSTCYVYLMAVIERFIPLELAHFIIYLALRFLLLLGVYNLTDLLFQNRFSAVLSLFLFACSPLVSAFGLFGGEPLMKFLLYHSTFTIPFLVFSLYLFLKKKYIPSLILLSLCYYFSALLANFVVIMIFFGSIIAFCQNADGTQRREILLAWGCFLLLSFPILLKSPQILKPSLPSTLFVGYLKSYYAGHCFPSTWSFSKWRGAITYAVFFGLFIQNAKISRNKTVIYAFIASIVLMWFLGFLFGEVFLIRAGIILQFIRSDIFLILFGLIFAAGYIVRLVNTGDQSKIILGALLVLSLIEIGFYQSAYLTSIGVLFILFHIHSWSKKKSRGKWNFVTLWLYRLCILVIFCLTAEKIYCAKGNFLPYMFMLISTGFLFLTEWHIVQYAPVKKPLTYFAVIVLLVSFVDYSLIKNRLSGYNAKDAYQTSWIAAQKWANLHTPADGLFIVPSYINGFRVFSKRPVFIEKVDGCAMHWEPGFERKWAQRLNDIGYGKIPHLHFDRFKRNDSVSLKTRLRYAKNTEHTFERIKKKYGADYVVTENMRTLSFPIVYRNDYFIIYAIP